MDEIYWTNIDFINANVQAGKSYVISKTSTEKASIEFAEETGLDLVTVVNPSLVVFSFFCPLSSAPVRMMLALVSVGGTHEVFIDAILESQKYEWQNKYISTSYLVSKTVTEKTALDFAEEHGLDLVTVVLPLVVGPFICPKIPSSVNMALAMAFGNHDRYGAITNLYMVHIEDAVQAHIFLLEYPNTKGRYICSSANVSITTIFEYLSAKYPEFGIPNMKWFKENEDHDTCSLSSMKLLDSGFKFKFTVEDMFDGAIQRCKNKGFL
ncbi:vestitone reductase-like [Tripterygium wilfordii]|uniref:vestitone reductase-like n=1 Tax=Tripterygium wilfordii TaxID=458696 RepID=UPI0018F82302|nr:vestitone reductase-like [Tripterygium wilfordii]